METMYAKSYHPIDSYADSYEIEHTGSSFLESVGDALTYGFGGAVVSGITSIGNTAIAFSNLFRDDKLEEMDIESKIQSYIGSNAASYYAEHKTGVDAAGFLLTAVGTGGVASTVVKGLLKGGAGVVATSSITGLKAGYKASTVANAELAIARTGEAFGIFRGTYAPLMAKFTHGQIAESAATALVAEALTFGIANQNPFINKDDLDYVDSFTYNLKDTMSSPLTWAFVGLDTTFNVLGTTNRLKKLSDGETEHLAKLLSPPTTTFKAGGRNYGLDKGSALFALLNNRLRLDKEHIAAQSSLDSLTAAGSIDQMQIARTSRDVKALEAAKNTNEVSIRNTLIAMTDTGNYVDDAAARGVREHYADAIYKMLEKVKDGETLDALGNAIFGGTKIMPVQNFDALAESRAGIANIAIAATPDEVDDILANWGRTGDKLGSDVNGVLFRNDPELGKRGGIIVNNRQLAEHEAADFVLFHEIGHWDTMDAGIAAPSAALRAFYAGRKGSNLKVGGANPGIAIKDFVEDFKASLLGKSTSKKEAQTAFDNIMGNLFPDGTLARYTDATDAYSGFAGKNKTFSAIMDEMYQLSRLARPGNWKAVDNMENSIRNISATVLRNLADDINWGYSPAGKQAISALQRALAAFDDFGGSYMYNIKEMMADAASVMRNGRNALGEVVMEPIAARKQFKTLQAFMERNGSIVEQLTSRKANLDLITGNLGTANKLPIAGDLGPVRVEPLTKRAVVGEVANDLSKPFTVSRYLDDITSGGQATTDYTQVAMQAQARLAGLLAKDGKGDYLHQVDWARTEVDWDDIPMLTRAYNELGLKTVHELKVKLPDGEIATYHRDPEGIRALLKEAKDKIIEQAAKIVQDNTVRFGPSDVKGYKPQDIVENFNRLSNEHLARMLDVGDNYPLHLGRVVPPDENKLLHTDMLSANFDISKPSQLQIHYKQEPRTPAPDVMQDVHTKAALLAEKTIKASDEVLQPLFDQLDISSALKDELPLNHTFSQITKNTAASLGNATEVPNLFLGLRGAYGSILGVAEKVNKTVSTLIRKATENEEPAFRAIASQFTSNPVARIESNVLIEKFRSIRFSKTGHEKVNEKSLQGVVESIEGFAGNTTYGRDALAFFKDLTAKGTKYFLSQDYVQSVEQTVARAETLLKDHLRSPMSEYKLKAALKELEIPVPTPQQIAPVKSDTTWEYFDKLNRYTSRVADRDSVLAQGMDRSARLDSDWLYVPPIDLRRQPYVAFAIERADPITGTAKHYLVTGATEADYKAKIEALSAQYGSDGLKIVTQDMQKDFLKAHNEWKVSEAFTQVRMDSALRNEGKAASILPRNDLLFIDETQDYIRSMEAAQIRTAVELRYHKLLADVEHMDDLMAAAPAVGDKTKISNYEKVRNLFLAKNVHDADGIWGKTGDAVAKAINSAHYHFTLASATAWGKWSAHGNPERLERELREANRILKSQGFNCAYEGAASAVFESMPVKRDVARRFVVKMNNVMSTLMLGMDFVNPFVNALATPVLMISELSYVRKALQDPEIKKQWREFTEVAIPESGIKLPGSMQMAHRAASSLFDANERKMVTKALENAGLVIPQRAQEAYNALDLAPAALYDTEAKMVETISKVGNTVAKYTGGDKVEYGIRYLAGHMAMQMADVLKLKESERAVLVTQFVNRVHGNFVTSAKAGIFQGVVGQAISLFQSYQMNLIQQTVKYAANNDKLSIAKMLAAQGTIFGMNGLPGWTQLNTALADLNREKQSPEQMMMANLPGVTIGSVDVSVSKFMAYGLGSAILPFEVYSRGNINPRNPTIVPTTLSEVPALSMLSNALTNVIRTVGETGAAMFGGDLSQVGSALARGIAHNGLNRPLAGIGQMLVGAKTTSNGNVEYVVPSLSALMPWSETFEWGAWAVAMGSKPLDNAIITDMRYKSMAYKQLKYDDLESLGKRIKQQVRSEGQISQEDMDDFLLKYQRSGGDIKTWNRWWARQLTNATSTQFNVITERLKDVQTQNLTDSIAGMGIESENFNVYPELEEPQVK